MSAARHIHPDQLAMLMPAKDLIEVEPNYADVNAHMAQYSGEGSPNRQTFWEHKLFESQDRTLGGIAGRVEEEGVKRPVVIHHSQESGAMLAQGHHRIVSAVAANPEMEVPVTHYGSPHHSFSQAVRERPHRNVGDTER